jgi:lipopolysaccharide export system permease protein
MLFDSTVRRELARSFGATLVVILTIVLTMFLLRTVGQAANGTVVARRTWCCCWATPRWATCRRC